MTTTPIRFFHKATLLAKDANGWLIPMEISGTDIIELLDRLELAESRQATYREAFEISENTTRDLTEKVIPNIRNQLEATEKERDELRAELAQLHKEADKFGDGIDWIQRALQSDAKIEQMEHPEPAAWMDKNGTLYNTVSHVRASDKPLYLTSNISEGWLRAIDEALVVAHIGVADKSDTYEQAKEKLNNLIGFHVDVATDPAVNWGYKLVSVRLTPAAPDLLEALQNIAEYWNQDQNETAMADACWHAIHTARAAIAKATGEQP